MRKPPAAVSSINHYDSLPSPSPTGNLIPNDPLSDVMLLSEAAAFLLCHPETLKKMAKAGLVPAFRVGSGWRFSRMALTKWTQEGGGNHVGGAA